MKAILIEDAKLLVPNEKHQNFIETSDVLTKGTEIEGEPINIIGLRRGEPFTYKLFKTSKNNLIYIKKLNLKNQEKMANYSNADAGQTPTKVNLTLPEKSNRQEFIGSAIGAVAGFIYGKYRKHDNKKIAMYIGVGAVAGYAGGYLLNKKNNKIAITPSK